MPSLRIIYDVDDWGYHRQAQALARHAPPDFSVSMVPGQPNGYADGLMEDAPQDVFLVLGTDLVPWVRNELDKRRWHSRLVVAVNSRWPEGLAHFSLVYGLSDCVIFDKREFWEKTGRLPGTRVIRNGVGTEASAQHYRVFNEVLEAPSPLRVAEAPESRTDLSRELTVFVTTVGASSYEACLQRLHLQDCKFAMRVLKDVAPMSAAFQRMLDDSTTPYFVQVDEDMLLHPHAIRTLHERIAEASPEIALFAGNLFDCHLDRCIVGVKIFRHDIVGRYPFVNVEGCEVDQIARLRADGFEVDRLPFPERYARADDVFGLHGTEWTPATIYERYLTVQRRSRRRPRAELWFRDYEAMFLERLLREPSELNFYALMGVVAGALSDLDGSGEEKDFRTYRNLRGFRALQAFWETLQERARQGEI